MFGGKPTGSTGSGLFGQSNTTGASGGLFGQSNQQQSQQQASQPSGLFGNAQNQQQQQQPSTGGGLFGQLNQQQPSTGGGLFGQQNQQQSSTGGGLFGGSLNTNAGVVYSVNQALLRVACLVPTLLHSQVGVLSAVEPIPLNQVEDYLVTVTPIHSLVEVSLALILISLVADYLEANQQPEEDFWTNVSVSVSAAAATTKFRNPVNRHDQSWRSPAKHQE